MTREESNTQRKGKEESRNESRTCQTLIALVNHGRKTESDQRPNKTDRIKSYEDEPSRIIIFLDAWPGGQTAILFLAAARLAQSINL
jgi:hypothetical protein